MTCYLTQALIPADTAARVGLRDSYDWHQAVWKAFPGRDGQQRDFLTRVDQKDCHHRLLIVSPIAPARPDWLPDGPEAWQTKPIPPDYFQHAGYRFQLRANPTKKITAFGQDGQPKKNSRRVPLVSRNDLIDWLRRKGEAGGFVVEERSLRILSGGREHFAKQGAQGIHSSVDFQGVLRVTDRSRFHETFCKGVGSAKAFGFGLLVIAPVSGG
jgi:CRISPR system Cascade subunit CasE